MAIDKQGYFCYISRMCYSPHYIKETLMLSTEDEQQVFEWSERQAGKRSSLASIVESDFDDSESLVEKSGTGICAEEKVGGRTPTGLLIFSAHNRFALDWQNVHSLELCQACQPAFRNPTLH